MAIDPAAIGPGTSRFAVEESRRLIDQKKAELYESIRQLNSRRNDLAPISALPPELLGRIFTFSQIGGGYCEMPTEHYDDYPILKFDFTCWLNFTYVSQKWRNVALNTPGLWDTPNFLHPSWARAMLERSKMADLVIDCDASEITDLAVIKEIFDNHAARIREINLRGLTSSFLWSILGNIWSSSLRLRSLQLSSAFSTREDNPDFPAHLLVQPSGLQRLDIFHCELSEWYTQSHPLLTSLVVHRICDRPLLSEFVTFLSGMPVLETLVMMHSLPLAHSAIKSTQKVTLPRLSHLHLSSTGNIFEILNVLDFLIVPCTTRVDLACDDLTLQVTQLPHIGLLLRPFLFSMTGDIERRYNQLRLSYYKNTFQLSAGTISIKQPHDPLSTDPILDLNLDLRLGLTHSNHQLDDFLARTLPGIPLVDLRMLSLDIASGHDTIITHFGRSTTLQSVQLNSKVVVSDFLHAITPHSEGGEHLESAVPFPALQSLEFYQVDFHNLNLQLVSEYLMERYEHDGAGPQKLCIRNCYYVVEESLRPLREIVPDVEWDGVDDINFFDF